MNKSVMKYLLLLPLYGLCACSSSKETAVHSYATMMWQDKPVVIDGRDDDWSLPYSYSDSKARIEYSFSNDKDNLYITMKSSDPVTQMKILHEGMQVWIDPEGKKNKTIGIDFPLAGTTMAGAPPVRHHGGGGDTIRRNLSTDEAHDLALQGFKGCAGGFPVAEKNPCGIEARIGSVNNELVWEAAIPLNTFLPEGRLHNLWSKPVSICFEINALKRPAGTNNGGGGGMSGGGMGGGMHGGRGGGMGGGGMHGGRGRGGGMRGGGGEGRSEAYAASVSWEKVGFAREKK